MTLKTAMLKFRKAIGNDSSYCCIPDCKCGLPRHPDTVKVEKMRRKLRPSQFRTQPEEA
jgi:hypothetical protein